MGRFVKVSAAISLALILAAGCGGGGSSDDNGGGGTPMTMTTTTAPEAAAAASVAVDMSTGLSSFAPPIPAKTLLLGGGSGVSKVLGEVNALVEGTLASGSAKSSYDVSFLNESENGACGGSRTLTASVNQMPNPTSMTGTATFVNYDDCSDEKMNGTMSFTGSRTGTSVTSSITFTNFSFQGSTDTASVNGAVSSTTSLDGTSLSVSANITVARIIANVVTDTLSLTNFATTGTLSNAGQTLTLNESGTIAYNDKSFTITTVTPMVIVDTDLDDHPSSGQLILDASGKARVTFTSETTVLVEVDPTEGGTYSTAYTGTWDNLMTITGFN